MRLYNFSLALGVCDHSAAVGEEASAKQLLAEFKKRLMLENYSDVDGTAQGVAYVWLPEISQWWK